MPQEILERPPGASFFVILSYQEEGTLFELKAMAEKRFSKILYESVLLPKWTPDETEREFAYPGRFTKVLSFKQRIHREELVEKKKECLEFQNLLQKKTKVYFLFRDTLLRITSLSRNRKMISIVLICFKVFTEKRFIIFPEAN